MALQQSQLDALHARLVQEKAQLQTDVNDVQQESVNASMQYDQQYSGYSNHLAETGTETFEQERNVAIEQNLEQQLEDVDRALTKFVEGTYGICDNCGQEIAYERLEALPQATLCITCASKVGTPGRA